MTDLLQRRVATLGPYSPLFYDEPLEIVAGERVWVTDARGERYLDGYNNVPNVGHAHPRVVAALAEQAARTALHTRYLNERVVDYAERLLATLDPAIDRIVFTNSGSESNDLAIRIARQHTAGRGMLVSDFSYHGHTIALAELTTGLRTAEGLAPHVRGIRIPDDVLVMGWGDYAFARFLDPPLSTLRLPSIEVARRATARLFALLDNSVAGDERVTELIQPELVLRASTNR